MKQIQDLLLRKKEALDEKTVNSNKDISSTVNSNTVNSSDKTFEEKMEELVMEENLSNEEVAEKLAEALDDQKSMAWYRLLAKEHSHAKLFEALSIVKLARREGKLKLPMVLYFRGILKQWNYKLKFR